MAPVCEAVATVDPSYTPRRTRHAFHQARGARPDRRGRPRRKLIDGTLFKGNTFKVERVSKSGRWAYGFAYGHVNRHDWVKASVLAKKT